MATETRCGFAAIVGRPNVGKSTLLNHLLGQRLSITSRKPQTTRHQILGVHTESDVQSIYVDTPGVNKAGKRAMNQHMNRAALSVLEDVDMTIMVVENVRWTEVDAQICEAIRNSGRPAILALNKVDRVADKAALLPKMQEISGMGVFQELVPISALNGHNVDTLQKLVNEAMPTGPFMFAEDQVTDRDERFLAGEMVREQIIRGYGDELPYQTAVQIEEFKRKRGVLHIGAVVLVERDSQKKILIGAGGTQMREIATAARKSLENFFDCKVMLRTWVKVKRSWSDDESVLQSLGFVDDRG